MNFWYYNRDLKPQGPVPTAEMRNLIRSGAVGPQDLISSKESGEWRAAGEWGVFEKTLFPATQGFIPGTEVTSLEKEWVLLVPSEDGKSALQEGPFSYQELIAGLRERKINPRQFVWKAGLSGWSRISDRPEFSQEV